MPIASSHLSPRLRSALGVALFAGALLSACSSDGSGDWGAMFALVRQSWDRRNGEVQLNEAAAIPYATLGVRVGSDPERIVVLATDNNGQRLWTSAGRVALTTRQGRIVATSGLEHDLSAFNSAAAFEGDWKTAKRFSWIADFPDLGLYSVDIDCNDVAGGAEKITILGKDIDTIRIDESCRSNQIDWTFTNTFWISQLSDRVWRSIQHIHPKLDAIEIELLRPPLSDG